PMIGFSHFGFMVEDPEATYRKLEEAGVERLPDRAMANQFFESRFVAPDGITFEISEDGWPGTAPVAPGSSNGLNIKPKAKFRHVAIMTEDPHKMAAFYSEVFGLVDVGRTGHGGVYMSDGDVNLAILFARPRAGSDVVKADVSHFG